MPIVKFEDFEIERYVLAACLRGPEFWRSIPESYFFTEITRNTYRELKRFLEPPYSTYPSYELAFEKVENLDIKLFIRELSTVKIDKSLLPARLYDLYEMYATRKVYDIAKRIPNDLEQTRVEEVIRARLSDLAEVVNPFEAGIRERGFIYESAKARWDRYRTFEINPSARKTIPLGISGLDNKLNGGGRPGHIICFFGGSGGYKTLTKANIAYNIAFGQHLDVMVITLEVPKESYELIIDARHCLVDYDKIEAGRLGNERLLYKKTLVEMADVKPRLYIVDIPGDATSADVIQEFELYYIRFGKYPDVCVLDYVNEMDPVRSWNNTGEKFKNLGVELRRITRTYKDLLITSMQDNAKAQEIQEKKKVKLSHMGESYSFKNVCNAVIYIYQDEAGVDSASNRLNFIFKKNRYGENNVGFTAFVNPIYKYVGDRQVMF